MPGSVLITGASSGIGAATADLLREKGHFVFGTSRRPQTSATVDRWVEMDVCDDDSVASGVAQVLREGPLDAIVCNAGFGTFGSVEEVDIDAARRQFETNYFGVLRVLRAVLAHMRERGNGRIVLVGSLAGRAPIPFQSHYSSSKAAVDALAMALRNELHPFDVYVSLVEPGDLNTSFNDSTRWLNQGSVYGQSIRQAEATIREALPKAPGPEVAARTIARALAAPRPRARYTVGPYARLVPLARRLFPDALSLRMIRSHFRR